METFSDVAGDYNAPKRAAQVHGALSLPNGVEATALTDQRLLAMQAEFQKLCVAFPRQLAGCQMAQSRMNMIWAYLGRLD